MVNTRPLVPFAARYRAAQHRVLSRCADLDERTAAARLFARSVQDLQLLGLQGSALLVAAEHMAATRIRTTRPRLNGVQIGKVRGSG